MCVFIAHVYLQEFLVLGGGGGGGVSLCLYAGVFVMCDTVNQNTCV